MKITPAVILILFILSCKSGIDYPEGGYDYVKDYKAEGTRFYFLPVRDSFSTEDSFWKAWESEYYYPELDEPNLSLKPVGEVVFRFIWSSPLGGTYIITLRKGKVTIKDSTIYENPCYDDHTNNLSLLEKDHLEILKTYFPIQQYNFSKRRKRYFDSLIQVYPYLLDSKYYYSLLKKTACDTLRTKYSTKEIVISDQHYKQFVDSLNNSGYWKLPVVIDGEIMCTDAGSYSLEANTAKKYNYVSSMECLGKSNLAFDKVCQQLIKIAKLEDIISVYYDRSLPQVDSINDEDLIIQDVNLETVKESPPKNSKKKKQ